MHRFRVVGPWRVAALCLAVGCGSEHATDPVPPASVTIQLVGDSLVRVGDTIRIVAQVANAQASDLSNGVAWGFRDTAIAAAPAGSYLVTTAPMRVVGRLDGATVVTASLGGAMASMRVRVVDDRPILPVAVGESVSRPIAKGFSVERLGITLQRGDTIDVRTSQWPGLRQLGGPFDLTTGAGGIVAGLVAPAAGTYLFDVTAPPSCFYGNCTAASGTFTFAVRRSGPVVGLLRGNVVGDQVAEGEVLFDTVWVLNRGAGVAKVAVTSGSPVVSVEHDTVLARGPASLPAALATYPPAGAVPAVLRIDAGGLAIGGFSTDVRFSTDTTVAWQVPGADMSTHIHFSVYDSAVKIVSRQALNAIAAGPTGDLVGSVGGEVYRITASTGIATKVGAVQFVSIPSIDEGPDSTIYVTSNGTLSRFLPGSAVPSAVPGWSDPTTSARAVVVARDGTLYVTTDGGLFRVTTGGVSTRIAPSTGSRHLVYSPADEALYYVGAGHLRRYDLARDVDEDRGALPAAFASDALVAVDARGHLYGFGSDNSLYVFDANAVLVRTIHVPAISADAAVIGGTVYGATLPFTGIGYFWRTAAP